MAHSIPSTQISAREADALPPPNQIRGVSTGKMISGLFSPEAPVPALSSILH